MTPYWPLSITAGAATAFGIAIGAIVAYEPKPPKDECIIWGYTECELIGNTLRPSTRDPKLQKELTKHVRQMVRALQKA